MTVKELKAKVELLPNDAVIVDGISEDEVVIEFYPFNAEDKTVKIACCYADELTQSLTDRNYFGGNENEKVFEKLTD